MKTPQLITTALLPNALIKTPSLSNEGKSGARFDTILNKEVQNSQKKDLNTKNANKPVENKNAITPKIPAMSPSPKIQTDNVDKSKQASAIDHEDEDRQAQLEETEALMPFIGHQAQFDIRDNYLSDTRNESDVSLDSATFDSSLRNSLGSATADEKNEGENINRSSVASSAVNSTAAISSKDGAPPSTITMQSFDNTKSFARMPPEEASKQRTQASTNGKDTNAHQFIDPTSISFNLNPTVEANTQESAVTGQLTHTRLSSLEVKELTAGGSTKTDDPAHNSDLTRQTDALDISKIQVLGATELAKQQNLVSIRQAASPPADLIHEEGITLISTNADGKPMVGDSVATPTRTTNSNSDFRESLDKTSLTRSEINVEDRNSIATELKARLSSASTVNEKIGKNSTNNADPIASVLGTNGQADNPLAPSAPPKFNAALESIKANTTVQVITPHIGTREWSQAISQKMIWMNSNGEQSALLTLNPPNLGPLQINLSINNNLVDASFISSHLNVREAIEAAAPRLRELMDNAGMSLSGFSVSADSSSSSSSNPFFQANSQERNAPGRAASLPSQHDNLSSIATINRGTEQARKTGTVDTFV